MNAIRGITELVKGPAEKWEKLQRKFRKLTSRRDDIQSELDRIESSSNRKRKKAVANWLVEADRVRDKVRRLELEMSERRMKVQLGDPVGKLIEEVDELNNERFVGGLVLEPCGSDRVPFMVSKLVGEAFHVNKTKIWEWLMNDEVLSMGIYGMGGVGKTTLMMHIYNQLLEQRSRNFSNIYWVTVSQDFSIYKIQEHIAKEIKLDIRGEDDEKKRAARLRIALEKRQRSVLILDDMWDTFVPEEVGLPINSRVCKLILTTRSIDICKRMCCQQFMKLEPLLEEESLSLFTETLGNYATLPLEVKLVAKSVARECAGLPLGLVALAGSMRGVDDIMEWRVVLEQLKGSGIGPNEMEEKVFKVLELSYDRLSDPALQECFLYCSLFPEDYKIPRHKLIRYLINDEIIIGLIRRKDQIERAHVLLNKLEKACLLQRCSHGDSDSDSDLCVKMHDLIRDMAIKKRPNMMAKAGEQLEELPIASSWRTDLARASFMRNEIINVPLDHSPLCHELSSLLLCKNYELRDIADCFFMRMRGLRILDLSETSISVLPNSVSNLVSLTTLLLRDCHQLQYVPSLATLKKTLLELDLFGCFELEQVPDGLELLSNLRYLNLFQTSIKDLPIGLFSHYLCNLMYLSLPHFSSLNERLACYDKLHYLSCRVQSLHDFFKIVTGGGKSPLPSNYMLSFGEYSGFYDIKMEEGQLDMRVDVLFNELDLCEGGELIAAFPTGSGNLEISCCNSLRSLDNFHCVDDDGGVASLRGAKFCQCDSLECLISESCLPGPSNMVNHVVNLRLDLLHNLRYLICRDLASLSSDVFSCLRVFHMNICTGIRSLFPLELLANLRNLEELEIHGGLRLEEIVAGSGIQVADEPSLVVGEASTSSSHGNNGSAEFISLPKLKIFKLYRLPKLKSICSRKISCGSLEEIVLWKCPRLERIPFSLVELDNGRPSPLPSLKKIGIESREWWDSVELDSQHPTAKHLLQPFLSYFY